MALTIAHHTGRDRFGWDDLVDAMTTVEAGTAVGVEYIPEETRAVAIHEAGHAAAGHVFMKGAESTRLSIRMRGGSLGHHQALEKEERFSRFRSDEMARLVWALGAMAAERVFYGENTSGVGGDVQSATAQAALMVGASAMGPEPFAVVPLDDESEEDARERMLKRFEAIGLQIMNRTSGGGPFDANPIAGVLCDRDKRALAAQMLGQAYVYGLQRRGAQQGRRSRDRRPARRAARDLRRRAAAAARRRPARHADDRPEPGGRMADDVNHHSTVDVPAAAVARERWSSRSRIVASAPAAARTGSLRDRLRRPRVLRRRRDRRVRRPRHPGRAAGGLRLVELAARGQRAREDAADRRPDPEGVRHGRQ